MKLKVYISFALFLLLALMLISAAKNKTFFKPTPIRFVSPKGWPKPNQQFFKNNPLTEQGFQLGRKLFYDGRLSADGQTSCANCHQQFASFATLDHDFSHGVSNNFTTRNAPVLINLAWMKEMHWDGGINHIEVQPLSPITNPVEMGETLDNVLKKIAADTMYQRMFFEAFGSSEVTSQRIFKAIAQFELMLVSAGSKYDRVMARKDSFTNVEKAGYAIYKTHCAVCHPEPLFTDNLFHSNGLSLNRQKDIGLQKITGNAADSLKFKTPTLRNAMRSYPYMHDGRIYALYQVVEHYNKIDTALPQLDVLLKKPIRLTEREQVQLVYFIYTLTDTTFLKNKRFDAPNAFTIKH